MGDTNLKSLCAKLNYKFRNIVLLHEALSHSFEKTEENKYFSPFPGVLYKQKNYGRLHTLGIRVFEHLIVEQAVNQFVNEELTNVTVSQDEKKVTKDLNSFKADLQNPKYFEVVGEQLSLNEYIKTAKGFQRKVEDLYGPVILAILGAIFIDSGGCYGRVGSKINPVKETRNVFLHLWGLTEFDEKKARQLLEEEIALNPRKWKFGGLMKRMSFSDYYRMVRYDTKLGYNFQQKWILRQALTVPELEYDPKLEILKAFGDSVWELVICEYLFWYFVNDEEQTHFNDEIIGRFCKEAFQEAIAKGINLKDDLMPEKAGEKAELQIYLKSLVGAIYVDSGNSLASAKKAAVHLCETNRHQIAKILQRPLPHSMKTYRGTYYHSLDKYCCVVDHGPPKQQNAFKITNVNAFMKVIDYLKFDLKEDHVDQLAVAKKEEEKDYKRILTCSEDMCNQLEYDRVSLYHTLDRLRAEFICKNGEVVNFQHTYAKCLCDGDVVTGNCFEVPKEANHYRLTKEFGVVTNEELFEALKILFIWMLMWVATSCKKAMAIFWRLTHKVFYAAFYLAVFYFAVNMTFQAVVWVGTGIINEIQRNRTHTEHMSRWERRHGGMAF